MDSTVITSTTRAESVGITRINSRASDEGILAEEAERESVARSSTLRSSSIDLSADGNEDEEISQATETLGTTSVASASLDPGPSILSTAAVAPSRSFASRRANAAYSNANAGPANRVVSFTTHDLTASQLPHGQEIDGGADSITMPDVLDVDNLSDVAEQVAQSSRVWRNEYESRLRALERNFNNN